MAIFLSEWFFLHFRCLTNYKKPVQILMRFFFSKARKSKKNRLVDFLCTPMTKTCSITPLDVPASFCNYISKRINMKRANYRKGDSHRGRTEQSIWSKLCDMTDLSLIFPETRSPTFPLKHHLCRYFMLKYHFRRYIVTIYQSGSSNLSFYRRKTIYTIYTTKLYRDFGILDNSTGKKTIGTFHLTLLTPSNDGLGVTSTLQLFSKRDQRVCPSISWN